MDGPPSTENVSRVRFLVRSVVTRSSSWTLPIVAHTLILWGILFLGQGEGRRRRAPGLATTVHSLPPYAWAFLFIGAGALYLIFIRAWAVGLMVAVLSGYASTLFINVLRYDNVSITAPLWPMSMALIALATGARVGARRPPNARRN